MIIIAYIFIVLLIIAVITLVTGIIVEKNFGESHPVKKWWRKHIVSHDPYYDYADQELDNEDNMK